MRLRNHTKSKSSRKPRPSRAQLVLFRRYLSIVLSSKQFREHIHDFRRIHGLQRQNGFWIEPPGHFYENPSVLEDSGRFCFTGLGEGWLFSRLVHEEWWESEATDRVVRILERDLLRELTGGVRSKRWSGRVHRAYYAGFTPFHPTRIWTGSELRYDLETLDWAVQPSDDESLWLSRPRRFIEVFPWTEEEDVITAFRQARRDAMPPLPRRFRFHRDLSKSVALYFRYCGGESMETLLRDFRSGQARREANDLERHLVRVAELLGYPAPRRRG